MDKARIRDLEAACAAMREVLEYAGLVIDRGECSWVMSRIDAALAPDAGRALLVRLKDAEARAVWSYPKYAFCRDRGCGFWNGVSCLRGDAICIAADLHDYFRDHGHIKEAE